MKSLDKLGITNNVGCRWLGLQVNVARGTLIPPLLVHGLDEEESFVAPAPEMLPPGLLLHDLERAIWKSEPCTTAGRRNQC